MHSRSGQYELRVQQLGGSGMVIKIRHETLGIALMLIAVFQLLCILAFVFLVKDMLPGAICTVWTWIWICFGLRVYLLWEG